MRIIGIKILAGAYVGRNSTSCIGHNQSGVKDWICFHEKAFNSFMRSEGIKNYKIITLTDRMISCHWCWRLEEWMGDRFIKKI